MRDQIKDREYFNEFLQEEQARITRFSDKLANSEVKPERQLAVKTSGISRGVEVTECLKTI